MEQSHPKGVSRENRTGAKKRAGFFFKEDRGMAKSARIRMVLILTGLLFISYGGVDWRAAWVFLASTTLFFLVFKRYLLTRDPELVRRRETIQAGTKRWDKVWLGFYGVTFSLTLIIAGLDAGRFHWSTVPLFGMAAGFTGYALSLVATAWIMMSNTHFEGSVRIQTDRNHRVIDTGPYAVIRHPGYLAQMAMVIAMPFALGSIAALIPGGLTAALFVVRTRLEDGTLKRELDGYAQYTERVRFRLVPGIW
jgi:protein-S-isoprenylcysteine O-methyltransferase Ste14